MMKKTFLICALALSASLMCASVLWADAPTLSELENLIGTGTKDDLAVRESEDFKILIDNDKWVDALLRIYDNTRLFEAMDKIFPQAASFPADLRLGSDVSPTEASFMLRIGFPSLSEVVSDFWLDTERKAYERWQRAFSSIERHLVRLLDDDFYEPLMKRYGLYAWLATNEGGFAYNALVTARDDLPSEKPDNEMRTAIEQFTSSGAADATEIFNAWARDIFSGDSVFKSVTVSEDGGALLVRAVLSSGFYAKLSGCKKYFTNAIDDAPRMSDMVTELMTMRDAIKSAVDGVADIGGGGAGLPDIAQNVRALQKFSDVFDRFFTYHVMEGYHSFNASAYGKMLKDVLDDPSLFRDPIPKISDALQRVLSDSLKRSFSGRATVQIAVGN